MRFEIDVQPMGAPIPGKHGGFVYQARGDALPAQSRMHASIQDEGMNAAIPCHIDEADQLPAFISPDMREAARENAWKFSGRVAAPGLQPERVEFIGGRKRVDAKFHHPVF